MPVARRGPQWRDPIVGTGGLDAIPKPVSGGIRDRDLPILHPIVGAQLLAPDPEQLRRRCAILGEEAVGVRRRGVARRTLPADEDLPARTSKHQGRAQASRTTARDQHIIH